MYVICQKQMEKNSSSSAVHLLNMAAPCIFALLVLLPVPTALALQTQHSVIQKKIHCGWLALQDVQSSNTTVM